MYEAPTLLPAADAMAPWGPAPELPPRAPEVDTDAPFDCVIVGAGFSGLGCAHTLSELVPSWRILVVDAMRVGDGSSGRNSGFVMDTGHWHPSWSLELNRGVTSLSRHGLERLRGLVDAHAIDCDWYAGNRYHVAVNRRGQRALGHFREGMRALGEDFTEVAPEELAERIGTDHYSEAIRLDGGAFVEPCSLIRGVADGLPDGVRLLEESPIVRIEPGPPHVLRTRDGAVIRAKNLVLATNGFIGAWGVQRSRVLPFVTFASVTEPLADPPGADPQWGLVPEEKMGCTVRRTADGRILLRNGVAFSSAPDLSPEAIARAAEGHRESLRRRFPALADAPFSHSWGGVIGATNNNGTVFGPIGDNAWVCAAHNGVGMAMGTAMGDLLAREIARSDHPLLSTARALPRPSWMPPQPLLGLGVRIYVALLGLLAGDEK
ncbi:MAG: FAD-binding oxidoreductase [Nannocystaceae bacterium]